MVEMQDWRTIADIRREYGDLKLTEKSIEKNPFDQFKRWFEETLVSEKSDPNAMVISTVDKKGLPDSRVVLLKGIDNDAFIFYTNYESNKAIQLQHIAYCALNFYWPQMARQVRIRGRVERTSSEESDSYFVKRPVESQLSAMASPQSRQIANRKFLEDAFNKLVAHHSQQPIVRPQNWGGYRVIPEEIEFWQGRNNRLHDRFHYFIQEGQWISHRLAP
jgi:pyridoxamine 5'-phosphate oxidase